MAEPPTQEHRREPPAEEILVVDDHDDTRETLAELLEASGYRTATAANGQQALDYLHRNPPPRLILLDLMMPVMNGCDFYHRMQREPELARIPVAIVSGTERASEAVASIAAVGFFQKPVELARLLETVQRFCPPAAPESEGTATG